MKKALSLTIDDAGTDIRLAADSAARRRPTIALFIPSLGVGGAERQAASLAGNLDPEKWRVLLLTIDEWQSTSVAATAVDRRSLGGRRGIAAAWELASILHRERVDILQAFLLGAQIYALGAKLFRRNVKLVAAVRSSMGHDQIIGWKGKISHSLLFGLDSVVDTYVFNSSAGERTIGHELPSQRKRVIANGIDTVRFQPDPNARTYVREIANVAPDEAIIGIVANLNVDKGYETFVRAAEIVAWQQPDMRFVVVGDHRNPLGDRVQKMIAELSLTQRFRFLGSRDDVERLVPGMDIVCSASTSEGFSNSIAEAMACGVPCVVTAVGDSALIIGETGIAVPPNDPDALGAGLLRLLSLDRAALKTLGASARERVERCFGIPQMVRAYEALYTSLLQQSHERRSS